LCAANTQVLAYCRYHIAAWGEPPRPYSYSCSPILHSDLFPCAPSHGNRYHVSRPRNGSVAVTERRSAPI
jgi:hypothetical protein